MESNKSRQADWRTGVDQRDRQDTHIERERESGRAGRGLFPGSRMAQLRSVAIEWPSWCRSRWNHPRVRLWSGLVRPALMVLERGHTKICPWLVSPLSHRGGSHGGDAGRRKLTEPTEFIRANQPSFRLSAVTRVRQPRFIVAATMDKTMC